MAPNNTGLRIVRTWTEVSAPCGSQATDSSIPSQAAPIPRLRGPLAFVAVAWSTGGSSNERA